MRKIRVTVTERLIQTSKRGDHVNCPVGRAIDACLPRVPKSPGEHVTVSTAIGRGRSNMLGAIIHGVWVKYPDSACEFITKYDAGEHVRPFSFDLEVPDGREDTCVPA